MRVVIACGHGKIALLLERLLAGRGDQAVGLIRNPAHVADVQKADAEAVVCDLEAASADDVAVLLSGAALAGLPAPPGAAHRLAAAVASGAAALGAVAGFAFGPGPARQPPPSPAPGDHGELAAQPARAQHQAQRPAGPETTAP